MPSIQDVAKEAGVSTATVSRTFSTPDLLSQQTRQRVTEAADRLNYRPRRAVADKGLTRTAGKAAMPDAIGFLFFASRMDTSPINDFYAPVLSGAQAEAASLGLHLIVHTVPRYTRPTEMPKMFRDQAVAGMLLVGAAPPDVLDAYDAHLPQSVLVDNRDATGRHDCVLSDGFDGVLEATRYLLGLGHRRIGFVMNEPRAVSFQDRRRGWLCALWEAGIMPDPSWIVSVQTDEEIDARLEQALGVADRPTAYIAANDMNAFALLTACRRAGVTVPADVSVIGFDDIPYAVHAFPPLTTLAVHKERLGRLAVRRLFTRIQESQTAPNRREPGIHLTVPVTLTLRETCSPPRT